METKVWQKSDALTQIQRNLADYDFSQIVRVLQRHFLDDEGSLRFRINPSLAFGIADVAQLVQRNTNGAQQFELVINFLGLIGQHGILPEHFTELVLERLRAKDKSLLNFFDIFHDKFFSLLYEMSQINQFSANYERKRNHFITDSLTALAGQKFNIIPLGDETVRTSDLSSYYVNLFGIQNRPHEGLRQLLMDYFQIPITIEQYQPHWYFLEKTDISKLSSAKTLRLEKTTILGKRIWQVQNHFTVILGSLSVKQFICFLPGSRCLPILNQLIRSYVGLEHDYAIKLKIMSNQLPLAKLTAKKSLRLGWNTYIKSKSLQLRAFPVIIKLSAKSLAA